MPTRIDKLTATQAAALIQTRQLSATELTKACLARIAERDDVVGAWAYIDPEFALAQAKAMDCVKPLGPLHGVPVGIKDIIDTADLPTGYGSPIYRDFKPAKNATCVERLIQRGAIILGKTVTTELANRSPGKTANPRNPRHTPGGSSSGSAAAVADWMVPMALGTQTTGSVIRPAAYCGVFGYKPTFGYIDTTGAKQLSPSLDTIGIMARSPDDLALLTSIFDTPATSGRDDLAIACPRLSVCRSPAWRHAEPATVRLIESVSERLARGGNLHILTCDRSDHLDGLIEAQSTIMAVETAKSLAQEYREQPDQLSAGLRALVERGAGCSPGLYQTALARAREARLKLNDLFGDCQAWLTPSTAGEAPLGLDNTGEPTFNAIWTLLHVPCVTVPAASGPNGLPIGIQVVGRIGDDARVLAVARWLANSIAVGSCESVT